MGSSAPDRFNDPAVHLDPLQTAMPPEVLIQQTLAELLQHQQGHYRWHSEQWRTVIDQLYLVDEAILISAVQAQLNHEQLSEAHTIAKSWVEQLRQQPSQQTLIDQLLIEYKLSSHEGLALMVLAESLLRIPDNATQQAIINSELCDADWQHHINRHQSFIMRCASHALQFSASFERWCQNQQPATQSGRPNAKGQTDPATNINTALKAISARLGEPLIRQAIMATIRALGQQFVAAETIEEALESDIYRRSQSAMIEPSCFDILGEAALSETDAKTYLAAYHRAIDQIAYHQQSGLNHAALTAGGFSTKTPNHSLSIKLSALHPRLQESQRHNTLQVILDRVCGLIDHAKQADIAITIDAEESERLAINLDIFAAALKRSALQWGHFGLAIQAYSKRHIAILGWLNRLSEELQTAIPVRLVKGAYWDSEIKQAQQLGLQDYPVLTQKAQTDCQYLFAAQYLTQQRTAALHPQFATHNALTISAIHLMSQHSQHNIEFQRLHGMGEAIYFNYHQWLKTENDSKVKAISIRKYAPIGSYRELLPYLIRRLVENSANSSFVHQLWDTSLSTDQILQLPLPINETDQAANTRHHLIKPSDVFQPERNNSSGINWNHRPDAEALLKQTQQWRNCQWHLTCSGMIKNTGTSDTEPTSTEKIATKKPNIENIDFHRVVQLRSPANSKDKLGSIILGNATDCHQAITQLADGWQHQCLNQSKIPIKEIIQQRAQCIRQWAKLIDDNRPLFIALLNREAGKTMVDAQDEIREAIDFCHYYANQAEHLMNEQIPLPGITGEDNKLSYQPRGIWLCISPWNFPLAIFVGQISAALASGNMVLAKPAQATTIIASVASQLAYQAGIHKNWFQLLNIEAKYLNLNIIQHRQLAGIAFTGSLVTARLIARQLAQREHQLIPFVAETGGQNAMIVDSTALLEQVVTDVMRSAFSSAGQRCSACRILLLQNDISPACMQLLRGALQCLNIGHPGAIETDVGPLISQQALQAIKQHAQLLTENGIEVQCFRPRKIHDTFINDTIDNDTFNNGYYSALYLADFGCINFNDIEQLTSLNHYLKEEVFGPVLHVISYEKDHIVPLLNWLNDLQYGLTLAIHSRNINTINLIESQAKIGNIYVNRDQVGAVVGSQPFGGVGLSGTGPKAGGPNYLKAFVWEKTTTRNTAAIGANTELICGISNSRPT